MPYEKTTKQSLPLELAYLYLSPPVSVSGAPGEGSSTVFGAESYHVGEFVYTGSDQATTGTAKHIILIEKIYRGADGAQMMSGNRFFRPVETFHLPTRKFLEREVFRTDVHEDVGFDRIVGRCFVMPVRDYFRSAPVGFKDEDVFVCESRWVKTES